MPFLVSSQLLRVLHLLYTLYFVDEMTLSKRSVAGKIPDLTSQILCQTESFVDCFHFISRSAKKVLGMKENSFSSSVAHFPRLPKPELR